MGALLAARPNSGPPQIISVGPPSERHADRVVAEMMKHIAKKQAVLGTTLADVLKEGYYAASPRAQLRFAERFRKAGGSNVRVHTGTKGRYSITFLELAGWDPTKDNYITKGDPLPQKPWLVCSLTSIKNPGKNLPPEVFNRPILFVTHHVLSRATQRLGLRTMEEIFLLAQMASLSAAHWVAENGPEEILRLPPEGLKVQIGEGEDNGPITLVFKKHTAYSALVAMTCF